MTPDQQQDVVKFNELAAVVVGGRDALSALSADLDRERALMDAATATIAQRDASLLQAAATIADLRAQLAAITPKPPPVTRTRFGANLVEGASWTGGARETARQSFDRYVATYGALPSARAFYSGTIPATFNTAKEGLSSITYLSFKHDPAQVAAGAIDARVNGYLDSIPFGRQVRLVLWHEPDDEMWVRGDFTAAAFKAGTDRLCDLVHAHPAGKDGRAEAWSCFMAFSVPCQDGNADRFDPACVSTKLDGIGWDLYWNKTDRWRNETEVRRALTYLRDLNASLGVPRMSLLEQGDNPHTNDPVGSGRVAFWDMHNQVAAELGVEDSLFFDVIGTTGDHRRIPGRWDCPPALVEMFSRYMKG